MVPPNLGDEPEWWLVPTGHAFKLIDPGEYHSPPKKLEWLLGGGRSALEVALKVAIA